MTKSSKCQEKFFSFNGQKLVLCTQSATFTTQFGFQLCVISSLANLFRLVMVCCWEHLEFHGRIFNASGRQLQVSGGAEQLTSLLVAVAGGKKRSVARQQLDRQRFDPPYQRHRHPRVLDWHHPGDRGHPATVLEQPEEKRRREASWTGGGSSPAVTQPHSLF